MTKEVRKTKNGKLIQFTVLSGVDGYTWIVFAKYFQAGSTKNNYATRGTARKSAINWIKAHVSKEIKIEEI